MNATTARQFNTINDIRNAHKGHWFDDDTIRFFKTTFPDGEYVHGHRYFVTGERGPDGIRKYTVREAVASVREDGRTVADIETVGEFQAYKTAAAARKAVRALLA